MSPRPAYPYPISFAAHRAPCRGTHSQTYKNRFVERLSFRWYVSLAVHSAVGRRHECLIRVQVTRQTFGVGSAVVHGFVAVGGWKVGGARTCPIETAGRASRGQTSGRRLSDLFRFQCTNAVVLFLVAGEQMPQLCHRFEYR
jgi:hypothetical protein